MLTAEKVSKLYNVGDATVPVLKNINFSLNQGDFVFLTGPSGAGKTTLIKLLILQEYPTKGKIVFENVPIENLPKKLIPMYRRTVGVVFQDYKLLEHKTVFENIAFVLEILDKKQKEVADTVYKLLELVNLDNKASLFPKQLSGGEKRRVVIARAIANAPKLLIADEPTGDLDDDNTYRIIEILRRINQAGTSIIMTTHNMELLERYPDHKRWRIVAGELNTGASQTGHTRFISKLQNLLSEDVFKKISLLSPDSEADILSLTPSFLRDSLKMNDNEIHELIGKMKLLQSEA
ncbi:MAG: ATP-binding cassette domain-containing protein [Candidatus Dojkabacteria bacterium]|nr:MAG: ATP-binding cassette domain-containing protein [Candidatus Dojkabacteria bacterium]